MFRHHHLRGLLSGVLIASLGQASLAGGHGRGGCNDCCQPACQPTCQIVYKTVEKTVMVPNWVTENRTVNVVECRAEQRTANYTTYRPVTETKTVQCEIVVPRYETRTRTVNYTVCKPVYATVAQQYTVMVPQAEKRQGTRQVCKMVSVPQTRTVCEDQGSWQEVVQTYKVGCGDCAQTCNRVCKVWAPKIVTREVQYTVMRPQMESVPYEYTVTVCHPETQTRNVQTCSYVQEQQSREVQYSVCVPEKQTVTRNVAVCRLVAEQQTCNYTVQVPYTVQKEMPVQVCQWVAKKVTCQVPVTVYSGCDAPAAPAASPKTPPAPPAPAPGPSADKNKSQRPAATIVTASHNATGKKSAPEEIPAGRLF